MEKVFDYLEASNIDVLRINADTPEDLDDLDDSDIVLSDEDEVDMEKNRPVCAGRHQHRRSGPHVSERDRKGFRFLQQTKRWSLPKRMADGDEDAKKASGGGQLTSW